ncbi:MAG: hypothetical protein HZB87_12255 [Desulfatitalea sp.]|nr:hypothetical protein [Desulfatitalea sp.]MBI5896551.1 hypothetical protein [Desulfobacterales bacterium]
MPEISYRLRCLAAATLGRVPDYVWQRHGEFKTCPQCRRVYWPGSHAQRWRNQIIRWFTEEK